MYILSHSIYNLLSYIHNKCLDSASIFKDVDYSALCRAFHGYCIQQLHSDGGVRSRSCAAYAFAMCLLFLESIEWKRALLEHAAFYVCDEVTQSVVKVRGLAMAIKSVVECSQIL